MLTVKTNGQELTRAPRFYAEPLDWRHDLWHVKTNNTVIGTCPTHDEAWEWADAMNVMAGRLTEIQATELVRERA